LTSMAATRSLPTLTDFLPRVPFGVEQQRRLNLKR
jgi:hypothetical protein